MFNAIYQAVLVHDATGTVHVTGQYNGPERVDGSKIQKCMVDGMIDRDLPRDWGWTREKTRVLEFTWSELPEVPEDIAEGIGE